MHPRLLLYALEDLQVFAVLQLRVLLAEHPREHLSGSEAGPQEAPVLVPVVVPFAAVGPLEPDLREYANQQLVHVVVDAHGHLDVLGSARARQISALCVEKKNK